MLLRKPEVLSRYAGSTGENRVPQLLVLRQFICGGRSVSLDSMLIDSVSHTTNCCGCT